MTTLDRFEIAPININDNKTTIFAPIDKINKLNKHNYVLDEKVYEDDNLIISLSGIRLTQIHRDILDVILFSKTYKNSKIPELGNKIIKQFTLYSVLNRLNVKNKRNYVWLERKLDELKSAVIKVKFKRSNNYISFNIIQYNGQSKFQNYFIVFENLYVKFFKLSKISITYEPLLDELLKLNNPVTRAAIRYLLTYSKGINIKIDNLLNVIGVMGGQRHLQTQRKKLIEDLQVYGSYFNISLINNRHKKGDVIVVYNKHKNVSIYYEANKNSNMCEQK